MKSFPKALWLLPLIVLVLPPLGEWVKVSPYGFRGVDMMTMPCFLIVLAGFLAIPICLLWFIFRAPKSVGAKWLLLCLMLSAAGYYGLRYSGTLRRNAFQSLAVRSEPLVNAIKRYETDHKAPPPSLEKLVPEYLPAVPSTGIRVYPEYRLRVGEDALKYRGNPWVLFVETPSGFLNFDEFLYFPLQNYPEGGFGGSLERMESWAYLHE